MSKQKCAVCNQVLDCPIHVTEVLDDGSIGICHICARCGAQAKPKKQTDLTKINTAEDLLEFITGNRPKSTMEPCSCGLTEVEFDHSGRFGCPKCYDHFRSKLQELVFPFHGHSHHVGKRPKRQIQENIQSDPEEKLKVLKLNFAKAVELENYEKAGELKKEIDQLKESLSKQ